MDEKLPEELIGFWEMRVGYSRTELISDFLRQA